MNPSNNDYWVENRRKSSRETRSQGYPLLVDRRPTGGHGLQFGRRFGRRFWRRFGRQAMLGGDAGGNPVIWGGPHFLILCRDPRGPLKLPLFGEFAVVFSSTMLSTHLEASSSITWLRGFQDSKGGGSGRFYPPGLSNLGHFRNRSNNCEVIAATKRHLRLQ